MKLPFERDAVAELESAAELYERERPGYGELFVAEVRRAVERAASFPRSGALCRDCDPVRDVRRFRTRRFPYSVVTAIVEGRRAVVAVVHARRRPGYWRDRIE